MLPSRAAEDGRRLELFREKGSDMGGGSQIGEDDSRSEALSDL